MALDSPHSSCPRKDFVTGRDPQPRPERLIEFLDLVQQAMHFMENVLTSAHLLTNWEPELVFEGLHSSYEVQGLRECFCCFLTHFHHPILSDKVAGALQTPRVL